MRPAKPQGIEAIKLAERVPRIGSFTQAYFLHGKTGSALLFLSGVF